MATVERFEDLKAWQRARYLVGTIYRMTRTAPLSSDRDLCWQMRRAAVSVMSNIAEGFERDSDADFRRFLVMARGSAGEVRSQLYVALDVGHIDESQHTEHCATCEEVSRMIAGLMKYLS